MEMLMSVDDYVIAQFGSINAFLADIHASIRDTNKAVGEIEGAQKNHSQSLRRVEKRLDDVTRDTQRVVDDLKRTTGELEFKLLALTPVKSKKQWLHDILTASNFKIILLIVASIVAILAGITIPI